MYHTRRSFLGTALAAGMAGRSLIHSAAAADPLPDRKIKYIDIHTHLGAFFSQSGINC